MLYREHWILVFSYLLRRTGDRELALDLAQDTFVKATRSFYGWSGGTAAGWLLAIARTVLIDHYRRHRVELPLPDLEPADAVGGMEDRHAFDDLLSRLPDGQASLLRSVYVEGFRPTELAEATGRTATSVTTALARARAAFRRLLDDDDRRQS